MEKSTTGIEISSLLDELEQHNTLTELDELHNEFVFVELDKETKFEAECREINEDVDRLIARRGLLTPGTTLYTRIVDHGMLEQVNERLMRASISVRFLSLLSGESAQPSRLSFLA